MACLAGKARVMTHRDRDGDGFRKLWAGQTVSMLGTQVTLLALSLVAIKMLRATPFQVGLLSAAEFVPFLLIGLPAGAWLDRLRRRPVMIMADVIRAAVLGVVPAAAALGDLRLRLLYAVVLVAGAMTVLFDVAYAAYLPSIVSRDRLLDGNAKLEFSRSGATLVGPGLAGLLIQALGAPAAIVADAVSYVVSALFVTAIRQPENAPANAPDSSGKMRGQVIEGLRFVIGHPLLRPIALCTGIMNLAFGAIQAVLLIYAVRVLHLASAQIGVVFAVGNGGPLLGALVSRRLGRWLGPGPAIVGSGVMCGAGTLLFPLGTSASGAVFLCAGLFLSEFASMTYNVTQVSLRQAATPSRLQGRINGTMRFVVWGVIPLGSLLGGVGGTLIGPRGVLWLAVPVNLAAALPPLLSSVRSLRQFPEPTAP